MCSHIPEVGKTTCSSSSSSSSSSSGGGGSIVVAVVIVVLNFQLQTCMWCRNYIVYLFIYNLFNIAVSNIGCIVANDCMTTNNELQRIVIIQSIVEMCTWMD